MGAPCDRVRRRCVDGARCQMSRGDITGTCVLDLGDAGAEAGSDAGADARLCGSPSVRLAMPNPDPEPYSFIGLPGL